MHCPGPKHVAALKRLLRYLAGTADAHLVYDFSSAPTLKGVYGYYDPSHADDVDTMRSTMASIFFFEGCPIYWTSKTNTYVTTSTNHSEYCASARAAKIAVWFHKTFIAMDQRWAVDPISLFSDSQGAIAMNYNPVNRAANRHINLADHYAREQLANGIITITYVKSKDQLADFLTKNLPRVEFRRQLEAILSFLHFQPAASSEGAC